MQIKSFGEGLKTFYLVSHLNEMESDRSINLTFYRVHHGDGLVFECEAQNITSAIARFGAKCKGSKISEFLLVGGHGQWVPVPLDEIEEIERLREARGAA